MKNTATIAKVSEIRHKTKESYYFVTVVADTCQAAREKLNDLPESNPRSGVTIEYAGSGFDCDHTFKISARSIR